MADEDEIDVLGDFSFNSCLAQNNQGIPSCSDREDTVHPQWLLDSTATNWYDIQHRDNTRDKETASTILANNTDVGNCGRDINWSQIERELLVKEMAKYGRNVRKISQTIKTKTEAEIQALIEAEYGVHLDTPMFGLVKEEELADVPSVVQEEIVTDDVTSINSIINLVTTGAPTVKMPKRRSGKQKSLASPDLLGIKRELIGVNPAEILYEDDLIIGSTESIGLEVDSTDMVSKNIAKHQKGRVKTVKKIGNHRRKVSKNFDRGRARNRSKDHLKSPQGRQRKDSTLSENSLQSPKMQIVLGSGQALPLSEGEQVIKIEKKKDSEESDIDVDIDSGTEDYTKAVQVSNTKVEEPIAVPLRKFEPMPRRQKKIHLDGDGGYTIMHTEYGDLYEKCSEPRKERQPKKQPVHLIQCRIYNAHKPGPYEVHMYVSTLISMDVHAHTSRGEVMGLTGGAIAVSDDGAVTRVTVAAYRAAAAAAARTHCDMDPVSQAVAAESLRSAGARVCGWHHSHPQFPAAPSATDLRTQRTLQMALERGHEPFLGLITSQHWPVGRTASHYRCIHIEDPHDTTDPPIGYQFSIKLIPDVTQTNLERFLQELRIILQDDTRSDQYKVDMEKDVCPQARLTYLEKCISSVSHHMRSAGYTDDDQLVSQLTQGLRDVFR